MGIPTCFSRNHKAFHCTVSRNHILDNTGKNMTYMRFAVSGRRTVIKYIRCSFCFFFDTFFENLFFVPKFFDFLFLFDKISVWRNAFVHQNNLFLKKYPLIHNRTRGKFYHLLRGTIISPNPITQVRRLILIGIAFRICSFRVIFAFY